MSQGQTRANAIRSVVDMLIPGRAGGGGTLTICDIIDHIVPQHSRSDAVKLFECIVKHARGQTPPPSNDLCAELASANALSGLRSCGSPCSEEGLAETIQSLKNVIRKIPRDLKGRLKGIEFLLDTCYSSDRAKSLFEDYSVIKSSLGQNDAKILLTLLAAAYADIVTSPQHAEDLDWFLSLLAAYAKNKRGAGSRARRIPLCPSRGDIAVTLYYLALVMGVGLDEGVGIGVDDVKRLVSKLIV